MCASTQPPSSFSCCIAMHLCVSASLYLLLSSPSLGNKQRCGLPESKPDKSPCRLQHSAKATFQTKPNCMFSLVGVADTFCLVFLQIRQVEVEGLGSSSGWLLTCRTSETHQESAFTELLARDKEVCTRASRKLPRMCEPHDCLSPPSNWSAQKHALAPLQKEHRIAENRHANPTLRARIAFVQLQPGLGCTGFTSPWQVCQMKLSCPQHSLCLRS